jgi:hypothetical protein
MREMVKHSTIFAKCFDNPALFEETKREVAATMLYEVVERTLLLTMR